MVLIIKVCTNGNVNPFQFFPRSLFVLFYVVYMMSVSSSWYPDRESNPVRQCEKLKS